VRESERERRGKGWIQGYDLFMKRDEGAEGRKRQESEERVSCRFSLSHTPFLISCYSQIDIAIISFKPD